MTTSIANIVKNLVKQNQELTKEFYKLKLAFGLEVDKNTSINDESIRRDQQTTSDVIKACNCIKNKMLEEIEASRKQPALSAEQLEELNKIQERVDKLDQAFKAIKVDDFMTQLTDHTDKLIIETDEYINNLISASKANIEDFEVKRKAALDDIQKAVEGAKIDLQHDEDACSERSALKFDDLKAIIMNFFNECKDDLSKEITTAVTEKSKELVNIVTDQIKERKLPECEVNITQRGTDVKNICIGPNITGIEMNGSILSISQQDNLVCNNGALINTIDDNDALAIVDERSKYVDEDLVGRYVEFTDYDIDTGIFTVGTHHDLTNKVFAIVKEFIPASTQHVIHKHRIIELTKGVKYVVIAFSGVVPVRVKEYEYNVCDVLVPNGDGIYTNNITPERLFFVDYKCIPRVKVLKNTSNKDIIIGLIC